MGTWNNFIADLTRVDFLKLARNEAIKEWGADIPTTLLFARLGKAIAEQFDDFSPDDRTLIFNAVEEGMNSGDTALRTFIATGLLETLYLQVSADVVRWTQIDAQLGVASRNYLIAWENIGK